jgi:hypothetical protein
MLISREAIAPVVLPEEQVDVPEIGGTVLVRGMDMPRLARFDATRRRYSEAQPGEAEEDAAQRAALEVLPLVLHLCVLAADEQPVYSAAQWAAFVQLHQEAGLRLADCALRLTGLDAPKNG